MKFSNLDINVALFVTLVVLFLVTLSLSFAISVKRRHYLQDINQFQEKIEKIKGTIDFIVDENNNYIEESQKIYRRIEEVEQEYERRHKEIESAIEAECKLELEKQKQKNQQDMEQFAQSKDILNYFVDLVIKKIQEEGKKYV